MLDRKEEFSATQRFRQLRSMLEAIELHMCETCPRAGLLDEIVMTVAFSKLSDPEKLTKIKNIVLNHHEGKNG